MCLFFWIEQMPVFSSKPNAQDLNGAENESGIEKEKVQKKRVHGSLRPRRICREKNLQ
jgi:hypothetical protein